MTEARIDGLLGASGQLPGPSGRPLRTSGGLWGPRGGEFQAAVDFCFRYSLRRCPDFLVFLWGGFWHRFVVLSHRVDFRSEVLSSGFSWLFRLHLETQAFDLKQVVILHVVFRFGKTQPLKKKQTAMRFWLSCLSHLEAIFVHVGVKFWLRWGFAFDVLLGALALFFGSLVGETMALISCIVLLRLFSYANALLGLLVTFREPLCDLFDRFAHPPGQGRKQSTASWTQRV